MRHHRYRRHAEREACWTPSCFWHDVLLGPFRGIRIVRRAVHTTLARRQSAIRPRDPCIRCGHAGTECEAPTVARLGASAYHRYGYVLCAVADGLLRG